MPRGVSWLHLFGDAAAILLGFMAAHWLRFSSGLIPAPLGQIAASDWLLLALLSLPVWLLITALHGLYYARLKQAFSSEISSLTHAVAEGLLVTILLTFALRALPDSRLALLISVALIWSLLALHRAMARKLRQQRPQALVIGSSPIAEYLKRQFSGGATRFDLLADVSEVGGIDLSGADALFCDAAEATGLKAKLPAGPPRLQVYLLPEESSTGSAAISVATVEGVPMLALKSATDLAMMRRVKRIVDIIGASILMILTIPFWLICLLGILVSMPGPAFFSHGRVGLFGKSFKLLKFRSMVKDAAKLQVDLEGFDEQMKLKKDPRITPFGKFLRKSSLDELPQLINILKGELSLVGPRPVVPGEDKKYGAFAGLLHTVPPGLTGLWQVSGRSDTSYQQRVDFDLYYINNWSLGLDLLIMLRTIPAVLSRRGAY